MAKRKTLKKEFEEFKEEFKKWMDIFDLNDWDVKFQMFELENSYLAQIQYSKDEMAATVALNSMQPNPIGKEAKIKSTAQHEALHLLLASLEDEARDRYLTEKALRSCVEGTVARISKGIERLGG